MKPKRRKIKNILCDLGGLMPVPELLSYGGTLIMRRSAPIWAFALLMTFVSWVNGMMGFKMDDEKKFSLLPITVAACFTLVGLLLKTLPVIFSKSRLVAESSHLNLMKDYRKSLINNHLDTLWHRVYQYEADVHYSEEGIVNEKIVYESAQNYLMETLKPIYNPNQNQEDQKNLQACVQQLMTHLPMSPKVQGIQEGFRINSIYAMEKALPQNMQREMIGFSLGALENYRDGAPFHPTDDKLYEDGSYSILMQKIKSEVRLTGYFKPIDYLLVSYYGLRDTYKRISQRVWFPLIIRAIGSRIGQAIEDFNQQFHTLKFTSQEFLWPGTENAKWISELKSEDGQSAKQLLLDRRKKIIVETFGNTIEKAEEMIDHLHLFSFEIATELRVRYDIEYASGRLDQSVEKDLRMMKVDEHYIDYQSKVAKGSLEALKEIESYLECHPLVYDPCDSHNGLKESQRAVLIAYYTNHNNIRRKLRKGRFDQVEREIQNIVKRRHEYTEKIRYLRKFQTLSYLNLTNYLEHLKTLAYSNK